MSDAPPSNPTEPATEPEPQMDVYSGVRWSAMAKYSTQFVEVATSLYVARIVDPECYGLLGMAIVITGFLMSFRNLGFSSVLIQRKEISDSLISSLFWVTLAISTLMAVGLVACAPLFSWINSDSRVGPIVAVLSVTFILSGLGVVPASLLIRRMAFQRLAWVDITVSATRAISAITLALAGWGVWALVWSSIAGVLIHTILLYAVSPWRPQWLFSWPEVRSVLAFGANLTGFSIFNYFTRNADLFMIGAFLGPTPLGHYSLAYKILLFPRDAITGVLTRVLFPAFSRMQDDDARIKAAYLRVCGAIAFITFPTMIGIAVVARPFVEVALGDKWLPAVPVMMVLAPLGALQSIWATLGQIFIVKGRADWYFRWGVGGGTLFILSFVVGLQWGILGVAVAYTTVCVPWSVFSFWLAFRLVRGLSLIDLAKQLLPYLWMSATMGAIVACLYRSPALSSLPKSMSLISCIIAGVVTYTILTLLVRPPAFGEFLRIVPSRFLPGVAGALARREPRAGGTK